MTLASGKLGNADLAAATNTTIYTCGAGGTNAVAATVTASFCNRGDAAVLVRLGVAAGANPSNAEWIEYGATIRPRDVLERTGIVMSAGERLVAFSETATVSVRAHGFEK